MHSAEPIGPLFDALQGCVPPLRILDVHTHIGANDPDPIAMSAPQLIRALARVDARAVVFPLREPSGYSRANDEVLAAAQAGDRLVPFCRVDPRSDPVAEARRCLDRGARGIKLHPHAERFDLRHAAIEPLIALAAERRVPVLVHAGSNIPPLGPTALELCARHPDARLILAHVGVCDGEWLWSRAADCPNLFFDLAWWDVAALLAALSGVAPGQLLHASDAPYGSPMASAVCTLRCCLQAGLTDAQIVSVMGGQAERVLAGADPVDVGPAPEKRRNGTSALARTLGLALVQLFKGGDAHTAIETSRALAAADGALGASISPLLSAINADPADRLSTFELLIVARAVALTPAVDQEETP